MGQGPLAGLLGGRMEPKDQEEAAQASEARSPDSSGLRGWGSKNV